MEHLGDNYKCNGLVQYSNTCFEFQAAIWHCLNHYAYPDAIFLAERLYAEGKF